MSGMQKELGRFVITGLGAVGTDLLSYYALFGAMGHSPAKALSFLCGSGVAYVANKYWTFGKHAHSYAEMMRFAGLYTATLGANVAVNNSCLTRFPSALFFAFLCATGTSTILNFAGQKWWVFAGDRGETA